MNIKQVEERLFFYDFEVFAHDWLVVFIEHETKYRFIFHNDPEGVVEFLKQYDPILCGYNNKHYDQYILKGVCSYYDPEKIKMINDFIIVDGQQGWMYEYGVNNKMPTQVDLMDDIVPRKSLKMLQGAMGLPIVESSIPFDHPTPWTEEEKKEIQKYCISDVKTLIPLWNARKKYLNTKLLLANMDGLNPVRALGLTNAKLTAWDLGAVMSVHDDERKYKYPDNLDMKYIPKEIKDFYDQIYDESIDSEDLWKRSLELEMYGMPTKWGWGGAHGALLKYYEVVEGDYIIVNRDLSSYYPGLKKVNNYVSRNIEDPSRYTDKMDVRLKAKAEGNFDVADPLKLVINTGFGCLLSEFNPLYDPLMGRSVCITGQLYQIMLMGMLDEALDYFLPINLNTDGIMFRIHKDEHEKANKVFEKFIDIVGIDMDEEVVSMIAQKDVNNYVAVIDGKTKAKGGWVSDAFPTFKSRNLSIVARAIVDYFVDGVDPAETINMSTDILDFQNVQKVGSTYQKVVQETVDGKEELQRTNRIYAGKDRFVGKVKKVKEGGRLIKNESGEIIKYADRYDTIQMCPPHALIDNENKAEIGDIDKKWYINLAKQRINEFIGEKRMSEETVNVLDIEVKKLKAAEARERVEIREKELSDALKTIEELKNGGGTGVTGTGVIGKIHAMRKKLAMYEFTMDGHNNQNNNDYVTSHQYSQVLNKFCMELGLEYDPGIVSNLFTETKLGNGKPWFWTHLEAEPKFIDVESGEEKKYRIFTEASDSLDKSGVKCNTVIAKAIVKTVFLITDEKDIDFEITEEPKASKFVPPAQKEKIAEKVVTESTDDQKMTEAQCKEMVTMIDAISEKKGKPYSEKIKDKAMALKYDKAKAASLIMQLEDKCDELGIEV